MPPVIDLRPRCHSADEHDISSGNNSKGRKVIMTRRRLAMLFMVTAAPILVLFKPGRARAASPIQVTLYKNPQCTCCEGYAQYLEQNGFQVDV
jgi:hypothetical protein